jgi:2'-5' RNA ligase
MPQAGGVDADPLVVTLALDQDSQAGFDALRRTHFPPERNVLAAHVTLFHALPGRLVPQVLADVDDAARRPPFAVEVTGLRPLGRGVAYVLSSPDLTDVHAVLRARWLPELTPQDRRPLRPHVTVQNKVAPEVARETLRQLAARPLPSPVTACGIAVWWYRGGPWEPVRTAAFSPRRDPTTHGA